MKLWILPLILLLPQTAFAYIDPGTASIVLQAIIGSVVAVMAFLSIWSNKIINFIRNIFGIKPKNKK